LVAESEKVAGVQPFTLSSCWSLLSILLSFGFPLKCCLVCYLLNLLIPS
jgi:hypothetical protein